MSSTSRNCGSTCTAGNDGWVEASGAEPEENVKLTPSEGTLSSCTVTVISPSTTASSGSNADTEMPVDADSNMSNRYWRSSVMCSEYAPSSVYTRTLRFAEVGGSSVSPTATTASRPVSQLVSSSSRSTGETPILPSEPDGKNRLSVTGAMGSSVRVKLYLLLLVPSVTSAGSEISASAATSSTLTPRPELCENSTGIVSSWPPKPATPESVLTTSSASKSWLAGGVDRYVSVSTTSSGSAPGVALCLGKLDCPSTKRKLKSGGGGEPCEPCNLALMFRSWLPGGTESTWTVTSSSLPGNSDTTSVCSVEMGGGTKRPPETVSVKPL